MYFLAMETVVLRFPESSHWAKAPCSWPMGILIVMALQI